MAENMGVEPSSDASESASPAADFGCVDLLESMTPFIRHARREGWVFTASVQHDQHGRESMSLAFTRPAPEKAS